MPKPIMKKSMLFFGRAYTPDLPFVPIPVGLLCFNCNGSIGANDSGVVFQRENASYASHRMCFANAAVIDFRLRLAEESDID